MDRRSRHHPAVQRLRGLLTRRAARAEERAFGIEGPVLVAEALDAGLALEAVFAAPGAPPELVERARRASVDVVELAPGVMEKVASTVTPQAVAAVAPWCDVPLAALAPATFVVVAAGLADPGNLGALLRAAEAAGADGVVTCAGAVDVFNPKVVRGSAGALFRLPVVAAGAGAPVLEQLAGLGLRRLGAVARGGRPYDEADLRAPVAVVLGSEAHGLAPDVAACLDEQVTIPMAGRVESLNVAVAGAVLCFEVARQRRRR